MPILPVGPFLKANPGGGVLALDRCNTQIGPVLTPTCMASAAGLLAWHRADTLAYADGADVLTWADQSGNARTLTGIAPNAPVMGRSYRGAGPCVRFTALTQGLQYDVGLSQVGASYSFHLLARWNLGQGVPAGGGGVLTAFSGVGGFLFRAEENATLVTRSYFANADILPATGIAVAAVCGWHVYSIVADAGAGLHTLYKDGVAIGTATYAGSGQADGNWCIGDLLGGGGGSGAIFDLAEIQLFNVAHTAAAVLAKSQCLRARWSLVPRVP